MTHYVVGFYIGKGGSVTDGEVVLIEKKRPVWLAGLLNGVGGKIEEGEEPIEAMVREFREETGVEVDGEQWKHFCEMKGEHFIMHCYYAFGYIGECHSVTDEEIRFVQISDIKIGNPAFVENMPWLFSMMATQLIDGVDFYRVEYIRGVKNEYIR